MQKRKEDSTDQGMQQFFYSLRNERIHKPSKVAAVANFFLQRVCHLFNLLQWIFFVLCDNWKALFLKKVYNCSKGFLSRHIFEFFETSVLKEICSLNYLHNNSATLILKSQNRFVLYYAW